jgi:hypothetical protein
MLLRFVHQTGTYPEEDVEFPCVPRVGDNVYLAGRYLVVKQVIYPITNSFGERCNTPITVRVQ